MAEERAFARGPMSEPTKEAVCRMYVSGATLSMIAHAVNRSPKAIDRALKGELSERVELIRQSLLSESAEHYFEMMQMLPRAREVIREALGSRKEELRVDTAWRLDERLMPKAPQRQEHAVTGDPELIGAIQAIARSATAVAEAAQSSRELRIRSAAEALPAVFQVEPEPEPPAAPKPWHESPGEPEPEA